MTVARCPGCDGVERARAAFAQTGLSVQMTTSGLILGAICRAPVDCTVNPAAIERGEEGFQCSRVLGHEGMHMACSIPGGWNSPPSNPWNGSLDGGRHPAYTWGLDFSALKAELTWLESGAIS